MYGCEKFNYEKMSEVGETGPLLQSNHQSPHLRGVHSKVKFGLFFLFVCFPPVGLLQTQSLDFPICKMSGGVGTTELLQLGASADRI